MFDDSSSPVVFGRAPRDVDCVDRLAAYAVIRDSAARVAVVSLKSAGRERFWLPGGGMEDEETPEQTIVREVAEELGRRVSLQQRIGQATQFFYARDEDCWFKMEAHFFAARLQGVVSDRSEFELQWIDPNQHRSDFFHECHAWAILKAS